MFSYRSQQITLAGEFSSIKDAAITRSLLSAFGVYHFNGGKVAAIARVDLRDPDTNTSNDRDTRIIAGLSYQLSPRSEEHTSELQSRVDLVCRLLLEKKKKKKTKKM